MHRCVRSTDGLKAFVGQCAQCARAPNKSISRWVQHCQAVGLYHDFGMTSWN